MLYLDVDRLMIDLKPYQNFVGRWFSPLRFRLEDHLATPGQSLSDTVRSQVKKHCGFWPDGSVNLLTGFGFMAHRFNPVSFYYCFSSCGDKLQAVVAEVTNTPWGERHCYVLDCRGQPGRRIEVEHPKDFHVSPFMPMNTHYQWKIGLPEDHLTLGIGVQHEGRRLFSAVLDLKRQPLTRANLFRAWLAMPFTSLKVIAAIHWQAFRLWLKKTPIYPHPPSSGESP